MLIIFSACYCLDAPSSCYIIFEIRSGIVWKQFWLLYIFFVILDSLSGSDTAQSKKTIIFRYNGK